MEEREENQAEAQATRETVPLGKSRRSVRTRTLREGTIVGRYRVLGKLGAGGVSVVYAAYDPALERKVALKLLHSSRARLPRARRRLMREAKAIARLSHPNIVTVHDVGVHESQIYVAMELVEGQTLRRWQKTPRPWREVLAVYLAAGRGVVAAHRAGVVHRDFKPENVVVGDDGGVRVLDFGLAASHTPEEGLTSETGDSLDGSSTTGGEPTGDVSSGALTPDDADTDVDDPEGEALELVNADSDPELVGEEAERKPVSEQATLLKPMRVTETGAVMGTPLYMSPEQHRGEPTDARTDQYSFCAALYEGLYRKRPFHDRGIELTVDQLGEIKAAGAVRDPPDDTNVPARIHRILLRGLAPLPADRWPAMEPMLAQLARDPAAARRRWLIGAGAALALAAIVAFVTARFTGDAAAAPCQNGAAQLVGVWDEDARQSTRAAFMATGAPFAATTLSRVEATLDAYTSQWAAGYEQACRDTHVHGTQSEELLDRRMACLQVRLARVRALTQAFARADSRTVLNAAAAVMHLPDVEVCADTAEMIASAPLPDGEKKRAAVRQLRERLAEASVLRDAGRDSDAFALARQIAEEASALDYLPIEAEAQLLLGGLLHTAGDAAAAFDSLERAAFAAEAGSHDHVVARSWTLATHVAPLEMREFVARRAEAAIVRTGLDELRAMLADGLASAYLLRGDYDHALAEFEKGLSLGRAHGLGKLSESAHINNVAAVLSRMGRHEEALARYQQSYDLAVEAVGPDHPRVGFIANNLGMTLIELGRYDEAEKMLALALPLAEARGEDHRQLAYSHLHLGRLYTRTRRFDAAREHLEASLRVWKNLGLEEQHRPLCALGELALARGENREARDRYERALAIAVEEGGTEHPYVVVALEGIGRSHLADNRPTAAIAPLRRALRIAKAGTCPPRERARTAILLARALVATGKRVQAQALARSATSDLTRAREHGAHADDADLDRDLADLLGAGN